MGKNFGTIVKLMEKEAVVMTSESDFVRIVRKPGMEVGREIWFDDSDKVTPKRPGFAASTRALAAIAAMLVLVSALFLRFNTEKDVYAYIDIDINPAIELAIDRHERVLDAKTFNKDGSRIMETISYKGKPVMEVMSAILDKSFELGYVDKSSETDVVLVSGYINPDKPPGTSDNGEQKIKELLTGFSGSVDTSQVRLRVVAQVLEVAPEDKQNAEENGMTSGRYSLYLKAKKTDSEVTVQQVREQKLDRILEKIEPVQNEKVRQQPQVIEKKEVQTLRQYVRKPEDLELVLDASAESFDSSGRYNVTLTAKLKNRESARQSADTSITIEFLIRDRSTNIAFEHAGSCDMDETGKAVITIFSMPGEYEATARIKTHTGEGKLIEPVKYSVRRFVDFVVEYFPVDKDKKPGVRFVVKLAYPIHTIYDDMTIEFFSMKKGRDEKMHSLGTAVITERAVATLELKQEPGEYIGAVSWVNSPWGKIESVKRHYRVPAYSEIKRITELHNKQLIKKEQP